MCNFKVNASYYPMPLQINSDGAVVFTVSGNDRQDCSTIDLAFCAGDTEESLFSGNATHNPILSVSDGNWKVTGPQKTKTSIEDQWLFTLTNENTVKKLTKPLVIRIDGLINNVLGTAEVSLEINGGNDDPYVFSFVKTPVVLYLRNFITRANAAANIPITQFKNGDTIYFSWESNGTHFKLFDGINEHALYEGPDTNFLLQNGIARDTTFLLIAEHSDSINKYALIEKINAVVKNPDILAKNIEMEANGALLMEKNNKVIGFPKFYEHMHLMTDAAVKTIKYETNVYDTPGEITVTLNPLDAYVCSVSKGASATLHIGETTFVLDNNEHFVFALGTEERTTTLKITLTLQGDSALYIKNMFTDSQTAALLRKTTDELTPGQALLYGLVIGYILNMASIVNTSNVF